jgi:hypothetical protein
VSFEIFMGEPEMLRLWNELLQKAEAKNLDAEERELFDKWSKSLELLSDNPRHPGLASHEIDDLSKKYGIKVWQSYLENQSRSPAHVLGVWARQRGDHDSGDREASQHIAEKGV